MPTRASSEPDNGKPDLPASVSALLALDDLEFVRSAYPLLLGRKADEQGEAGYVSQLRAGHDKRRIVADLAHSAEGRSRPNTLPGLSELLRELPPRPAPWLRRAARALLRKLGGPAREPLERSFRAMDNRLYRLEALLKAQHEDIGRLHEEITQLAISLDKARGGPVHQSHAAPEASSGTALGVQAPARVEALYRLMNRTAQRRRAGTR